MPNQNNFRSDVTNNPDVRFLASRIIRVPEETIFFEEVAASFAFDMDDNIELHFYTMPSNQLILSTVTSVSDQVLKSHIVSYEDGTYKNYLKIDFTKLFVDKNLILVPGDYRMVLNLFSDEIGTYYDRKLAIDAISPSRTEVQLSFNDTTDAVTKQENLRLLREFVEKSFNKADAVGVVDKVFKSGVELDDATEGLLAASILQRLEIVTGQTFANTTDRMEVLQVTEIFQNQLNQFLVDLYSFIREEIVINSDDRVQLDQFKQLVRSVVEAKIHLLQQTVDSRIRVS